MAGMPPLAQVVRVRAAALEARGAALCRAGRDSEGEPMLGEAVGLRRWLAVIAGFVGADHVAILPLAADGADSSLATVEALAPTT